MNFALKTLLVFSVLLVGNLSIAQDHQRPSLNNNEEFKAFYDRTLRDGVFSHIWNFGNEDGYVKSEQELFKVMKKRPDRLAGNPWTYMLHPSYQVRKFGYDRTMSMIAAQLYNSSSDNLRSRKTITTLLEAPSYDGSYHLNYSEQKSLPMPGSLISARDVHLKDSAIVKWLTCLRFSPLHARKCSQALDEIVHLMSPAGGLTAIPIIKEVLEDERYMKGASIAALKIMKKVDLYEAGLLHDPGDLYFDLFSSYLESGLKPKEAEKLTWNLLAVYSSRGANIGLLYPYLPFNAPNAATKTLVALDRIANGLGVLDTMAGKTGHLYSLPKEIFSVAPYGKPYHFWMSAFLSRRTTLQFGEDAARGATAISEIGYQILSTTYGREHLVNNIITKGPYSSMANKTRIDLAFGFAGAKYGSAQALGQTEKLSIDVDLVVKNMINSVGRITPWSVKDAEKVLASPSKRFLAYLRWQKIISPITGLRAINSQKVQVPVDPCLSFMQRMFGMMVGKI